MSKNKYLFNLINISKSYYTGRNRQVALKVKNLSIPQGGVTAILGNSGSGKTTLLNILSLLDTPDEKYVDGDGSDECRPALLTTCFSHQGKEDVDMVSGGNDLASIKKDTFGFVFQQGYLLENLPGKWNIQVPLDVAGLEVEGVTLDEFSRSVMLDEDQQERLPSGVSGGEGQRIAVARSIVHGPKVVIADEPSSSLDPIIGAEILKLLTDWCRSDSSRSLIWVTHNVGQAAELADNIIIMSNGKPSPVRKNPRSAETLLSWMQDAEREHISSKTGGAGEAQAGTKTIQSNDGQASGPASADIWAQNLRRTAVHPIKALFSFVLRISINDVFPMANSSGAGGKKYFFRRRSVQTLNIVALFMIVALADFLLSVHFSLYNYFVDSETDARINNIRVMGKLKDSDATLSEKDIEKLRSLVWVSEPGNFKNFVTTKRQAQRKQLTIGKKAVIDVRGARLRPMDFYYDANALRFSPTETLEIVTLSPDDPILETIGLLHGDDIHKMAESGENLADAFGRVLENSNDKRLSGVVVKKSKLIKDLGFNRVPKELEVELGGERVVVPVLAVVDWLPFYGSMLMTNDWYEGLYLSRGSSDALPGYEYVTVYIDHPLQDGLAISNAIHENGYMLADDVRDRLSWINDLTEFVLFFSTVALVGVAIVVCMTLFISYADTIKKRQKEIGVLIAFGISNLKLNLIFISEVIIVWLVACLLLIPAHFGIQYILKASMGSTLNLEPEKLEKIVSMPHYTWIGIVSAAFVIAVVAAVLAVRTISKLNVANILREG